MILNGYFDGVPFTAEFYLRDEDRISVTTDNIHFPIVAPTRNLFSGCGEQNKKYFNIVPTTVEEALKLASEYLKACINSLEPDCFIVGGHIHIAHLNLDGFSWIDKPVSSTSP